MFGFDGRAFDYVITLRPLLRRQSEWGNSATIVESIPTNQLMISGRLAQYFAF